MLKRSLSPLFVVLWTSGYVIGALAVQVSGALPLLEIRFVLAALIAVPLALRGERWRGAPLGRLALVGLLLQVVQFGGVYGGLALGVPPGVTALVMLGASPLLTTALAIVAGQERAGARRWTGLAIGAAGVGIGIIPELAGAHLGVGLIVTGAGMVGLSAGTVLQKRHTTGVDPRVSAAVQSVTAAVVVAPVLGVFGGHVDVGAQFVLTLGWLGAVMGVGTVLVFIRLLTVTSAGHVGTLLLIVPALTALASAPVLGEPLHSLTLAGMAVSGAGVFIALHGPRRCRTPRHGHRAVHAVS